MIANLKLDPGSTFAYTSDSSLAGSFTATGGGVTYDPALKKNTSLSIIGVGGVDVATGTIITYPGTPNAPLYVFGDSSLIDTPVDLNSGASYTLSGSSLQSLAKVENLAINLLNGHTTAVDFFVPSIYTNSTRLLLRELSVDAGGTLSSLSFHETGATVFTPTGPSTGQFSIAGALDSVITNLHGAIGSGAFPFSLSNQTTTAPFQLTGTYTVSALGGGARRISLDGNADFFLPMHIIKNLVTGDGVLLSLTATLDLVASLTVSAGYHFETTFLDAPEPGSIVLLGIGLLALVPATRWRKR